MIRCNKNIIAKTQDEFYVTDKIVMGFVFDIHKRQLINYLMITGIKHGKLINFRSGSVEFEFVSTSLTKKDRYNYYINTDEWEATTPQCEELKNIVCDLLTSWGSFLECQLYNEALIHFLGGSEKVIFPVEIYFNNQVVGKQKMCLLNEDTTFHLSAITRAFKGYENNIRLLIEHTKIQTVQWINLAHHEIKFKTIKKV